MPRHTGQTWVLGSAPNAALQPQKIFVAVSSWAWISRPMTASNVSGAKSRTRPGRNHLGAGTLFEGLEVVGEHLCQPCRRDVVLRADRPRAPRLQHLRRHAGARGRNVEVQHRILLVGGVVEC